METSVVAEVRRFVVVTFLLGQADRLRDDASFIGEGLIDSTGILELVSFIEEHFEIEVADYELIPENLDSVHKVSAFVSRKMLGREGSPSAEQVLCG